jgi:hypothetical protein
MNSSIQLKRLTAARSLVGLVLIVFAGARSALAVVPAPDGGYPGGNTAEGQAALLSLTTGTFNTGVGFYSLRSTTTNGFNTAVGAGALISNTAALNTATGTAALLLNTTGHSNTANGALALLNNTTGESNTAVGKQAAEANTAGNENTALGAFALMGNMTGSDNTAVGKSALLNNTTGDANTAVGQAALINSTTGESNTAVGTGALVGNDSGSGNTAIGRDALFLNIDGNGHTAVGFQALQFSQVSGQFCFGNTAVGSNALVGADGCGNTALGAGAGASVTTGGSNTLIGLAAGAAVTNASNVIAVGVGVGQNASDSCFIGNIWQQLGGSQAVYVNSDGKLGAQVSSRRFKEEIKPMEQASEIIYGLKPVSFRYKADIELARPPSFGLVAEDVEAVSADLVLRDKEGKPYSVRYDQVNAMLLNEFLKEHRKNAEQQVTIAELRDETKVLAAKIKAQTAQIQRISAQLEVTKTARQLVNNDY